MCAGFRVFGFVCPPHPWQVREAVLRFLWLHFLQAQYLATSLPQQSSCVPFRLPASGYDRCASVVADAALAPALRTDIGVLRCPVVVTDRPRSVQPPVLERGEYLKVLRTVVELVVIDVVNVLPRLERAS